MRFAALLCCALALNIFPLISHADEVLLAPNHPDRHVVVKGDTLWDIAKKFLRDPWRWTEIWEINPAVKNPHLIYPGDLISLIYREGKPVLRVTRAADVAALGTRAHAEEIPSNDGLRTLKLSPQAQVSDLGIAIPTIAIDAIKPYLLQSRVMDKKDLDNAPYVVAFGDGHSVGGRGDRLYVRKLAATTEKFSVYRRGTTYRNPGSKPKDVLGYEAMHVADVIYERGGEPATLLITHAYREILIGDHLLPAQEHEIDQNFLPRAPDRPIKGQIIDIVDAIIMAGRYQVVVLNLGTNDGLEPGHVLAVHRAGVVTRDIVTPDEKRKLVTLPEERSGLLMVFRPFEKVSYALLMQGERETRLYDIVRNPNATLQNAGP